MKDGDPRSDRSVSVRRTGDSKPVGGVGETSSGDADTLAVLAE